MDRQLAQREELLFWGSRELSLRTLLHSTT